MKIKFSLTKLNLVVFIFLFIFAPPVLPKMHFIIGFLSFFFVLTKKGTSIDILKSSGMWSWILLMLILAPFIGITTIISAIAYNDLVQFNHYISLYTRYLSIVVIIVPATTAIIYCLNKYKFTWTDYLKGIIKAGMIQAVLDIVAYAIPQVRQVFLWLSFRFTGDSLYTNWYHLQRRFFGIAYSLTDEFGWGMGMLAGFALVYGFEKEKKYILYSMIILLGGVINARTTIIIYILAVVVIIVRTVISSDINKSLRYFFIMVLAIMAVMVYWKFFLDKTSVWYMWLSDGLTDVLNLLTGSEVASKDVGVRLFSNEWWEMPDLFRIIIGTGHSRYEADGYTHTDVGYVNDIWVMGLVGIVLVYGFLIKQAMEIYRKNSDSLIKSCILFASISLFVFNVKAGAITYNVGPAIYFSFMFISYFYTKMNIRKDD